MKNHTSYLLRALELAQLRRGFCAPNPAVGAVVVKNDQIIGEGYHFAAGHPHAEVMAIANLSPEQTRDASLYVTLEPCCHTGRTPPCTDLIKKQRLKAVYYAQQDCNPMVAGKGAQQLRDVGIACEHIQLPQITEFYRSYSYWQANQKPWVTAKLALSLDGKIAGEAGRPVQITGEALKKHTHQGRLQSDALLTTAKTIIADDPKLNVRLENKLVAKKIYVLDSKLTTPLTAQIFKTAEQLIFLHQPDIDLEKKAALNDLGAKTVAIDLKNQQLDLDQALQKIGADGIHDLWAEAGGYCFSALIKNNLTNTALIYIGSKIIGPSGYPAFQEEMNFFTDAKTKRWYNHGLDAMCEITF